MSVRTAAFLLATCLVSAAASVPAKPGKAPDERLLIATMASLLPGSLTTFERDIWVSSGLWFRAARKGEWPRDLDEAPREAVVALKKGLAILAAAPLRIVDAPGLEKARAFLLEAVRLAPRIPALAMAATIVHVDLRDGTLVTPFRVWLTGLGDRAFEVHLILRSTGSVLPSPTKRWLADSLLEWAPVDPAARYEAALAQPVGTMRRFELLRETFVLLRDLPGFPEEGLRNVVRDTWVAAAGASLDTARTFEESLPPGMRAALLARPDPEFATRWDTSELALYVAPSSIREEMLLALELSGEREKAMALQASLLPERPSWGNLLARLRDGETPPNLARALEDLIYLWRTAPDLANRIGERIASRSGLEFLRLPPTVQSSSGGWHTADWAGHPLRVRLSERRSPEAMIDRLWNDLSIGWGLRSSKTYRRDPQDVRLGQRDSDRDGLSDEDEVRLLTRVERPDTDADGLPDGQDPMPHRGRLTATDRSAAAAALVRSVLAHDTDKGKVPPALRFQDRRIYYLIAQLEDAADLHTIPGRWVVLEPGEEDAVREWTKGLMRVRLWLSSRTPRGDEYQGCWHDDLDWTRSTCATICRDGSDWVVRESTYGDVGR